MLGRVAAWREPAWYQPAWLCHRALPVVVPWERGNPPGAVGSGVWVLGHVRMGLGWGWSQFSPPGKWVWRLREALPADGQRESLPSPWLGGRSSPVRS